MRTRTANVLSEVFQPPVTVLAMLLLSPAVEPGFPATAGYGAVAGLFVCILPLASVLAGVAVLLAVDAPRSVLAATLSVVAGVVIVAIISAYWKISGHAAAVSSAVVVIIAILGPAWLPLLALIPVVGWSRLVLRAHSLAQVVAGTLFGAVVMAGTWWLFLQWLL